MSIPERGDATAGDEEDEDMGHFEREGEEKQDEEATAGGEDEKIAMPYCRKCGWHGEPDFGEMYEFCPDCGSENLGTKAVKFYPKAVRADELVARVDKANEASMRGFVEVGLFEQTFDKLNDALGDVANRMMEQETTIKGLVKAIDEQNATIMHQANALWGLIELLKPRERIDPASAQIPFFRERVADREPTPMERFCFVAGVSFALAEAGKDGDLGDDARESVIDSLGVPTVKCSSCEQDVPAETAFRVGREWYGLFCCEQEGRKQIQYLENMEAAKRDARANAPSKATKGKA